MVFLSSIMAISFSFLSVNSFIDGLDKGLNGVMYSLVQNTILENGKPKKVMNFHVASRWEDMPSIIQERFSVPSDVGILHKTKDQSSMFSIPESIFFVIYYVTPEGDARYISRVLLEEEISKSKEIQPENRIMWIAVGGLSSIAIFAFLLIIVMNKISKPIVSLRNWAKSLNKENLQLPPPDFTYNELNTLATFIRSSLVSTHESLEREQQFLSYASHELRTPISVIRSNVELLNRLSEKSPLNEKQNLTIQRIQRASLTMSDLTNTLLWLSRTEEQHNELEPVNLHEKINILCNDLNYLLNGKQVKVIIKPSNEDLPIITDATACHIVLTNLIRNAFQHTQSGEVEITVNGSRVVIVNSNQCKAEKSKDSYSSEQAVLGYGLGLKLSEKIIKRHRWSYNIYDTTGRYEVVVGFE